MSQNTFYRNSVFSIRHVLFFVIITLYFIISMPLVAAESSRQVRLRNAVIDTASAGLSFPQSGKAADKLSPEAAVLLSAGQTSHPVNLIIQFSSPIREEWKRQIAVHGDIRAYIPDNALIVRTTTAGLGALADIAAAQWIGVLKPEYKIQPGLFLMADRGRTPSIPLGPAATNAPLKNDRAMPALDGKLTVRILLFSAGDVEPVSAAVRRTGGEILGTARGARAGTLRARVRLDAVFALADLPEVEWIEKFMQPEILNDVSAGPARMNANIVHTNFGLTGQGQVLAVCDTGLDTGDTNTIHPDFTNRVRAAFGWARPGEWSDLNGHGTHCSGSVLGNGSAWSNGLYQGMSYQAELVIQSCGDKSSSLYLPDDLNEIYIQAYTNGARIHSDSWGSSHYGEYTISSKQSDEFIWNHPDMLIVFAVGNSGVDADGDGVVDPGSICDPATAKNVLAVGAAISERAPGSGGYSSYTWGSLLGPSCFTPPLKDGFVSEPWDGVHQGMAAFSSRGPCNDGRVKPDIVAPGTDIISCRSQNTNASTLWGTGTGVLANAASNYYTFCGGTSMATPLTAGAAGLVRQYLMQLRGLATPSAALVKALLAAGARSLAPGQYGLGNTREIPFGSRPDIVQGWGHVDLGNTLFPTGGTNILVDGDSLVTGAMKTYSVTSSSMNRLSIVLAWSDYPASPVAGACLVNDLDLRVVAPDGTILYPNGLHGADRTNNMEGVDIFPAQSGTYEVQVEGWNVPQGPQPFALAIQAAIPSSAQAVDGLWHDPSPVTNGAGVRMKATVIPGTAGVASVSGFYRVNGGAWASQAMSMTNSAGGHVTYAADFPSLSTEDRVEYFTQVQGCDGGISTSATNAFTVWGAAMYVSPRGSGQSPYDTPAKGFTNIMGAVQQADSGMTILVDRGTYREAVSISKPLALRSLYGAAETVVDGENSRCCLWVSNNVVVDGFTFTRGYANGDAGGVNLRGGRVFNCVISNNLSGTSAGGAAIGYGGWVEDSTICHNTGAIGGLATLYGGQCNNSLIISNTALQDGGGAILIFGGTMSNCVIRGNSAGESCGGLMMVNLFTVNTEARNCLIADNTAPTSAAVYISGGGLIYNCTIAGNHGQTDGALICRLFGIIMNSIIYGNTPSNCTFNAGDIAILLKNSCTVPAWESADGLTVVNQLVADPKFRNTAAGDYRLCANSPCRDAGTNLTWMTGATDLEGRARIINNIVDIGAYELPLPRDMWNFAAVRNAFADFDGDGLMDPAVYNPTTGIWIISLSGSGYRQTISQLGGTGYTAVPGDYNGDRRTELAVYQETTGLWILQGNPATYAPLGGPGWRSVPGDYDGDGKADPSIYYSNGDCQALLSAYGYGLAVSSMNMVGAQPVFGDFDGDDQLDPAMYLEASGLWGVAMSGSGYALVTITLGGTGWTPAVADYDGDGRTDPMIYQETTGLWNIFLSNRNYDFASTVFGGPGYKPVPGEYDGDGLADPALYNNSTGTWIVSCSRYGYQPATLNFGGPEYIAVNADR
jgi:hypothetical protein